MVKIRLLLRQMKKSLCILSMLICTIAQAQPWVDDLATGLSRARGEGKKVLLLFSVADGCAVCHDLEDRVFKDDAFIQYASTRFVLVREDFSEGTPEARIRHLSIVEKYNRDGFFPLVLILDADGRVLKKTGPYEGEDAQEYIKILQRP